MKLPGLTPEMMAALSLVAGSPHGATAKVVYTNTDIEPRTVYTVLRRLTSLGWLVEPEKAWFRASPDGVRLARLWQLAHADDVKVGSAPLTLTALDKEPVAEMVRQLRAEFRVSQSDFATLVREVGMKLGVPNACSKRLVQKWEHGHHLRMRPNYEQALALLAGRMKFAVNGDGVVRAVPTKGTVGEILLSDPSKLIELGTMLCELGTEAAHRDCLEMAVSNDSNLSPVPAEDSSSAARDMEYMRVGLEQPSGALQLTIDQAADAA